MIKIEKEGRYTKRWKVFLSNITWLIFMLKMKLLKSLPKIGLLPLFIIVKLS
jgi:hypothetical protein